MSQPNTGKKKVPGPNIIKKHQQKKEYSLRSRHQKCNSVRNKSLKRMCTASNE